MKNIIISVSKKIGGKYEKQGEVAITVPTLEDIQGFVVGDKAKITGEEDGLPVYADDVANWVQSAMLSYVKANARNKLVSGTATLKPGLSIPTNWAELCAEGERGGNGAALKLYAEVKDAFAKWASTLGKSETTVKVMTSYFNSRVALEMASADHKAKLEAYVQQFAESLDAETLERYTGPIERVLETCAVEASDFE